MTKRNKQGEEMLDDDGQVITTISKFEETIYNERIKQWIRDEASIKASIRSLYNSVWGQCSKLMQDKITMMKGFSEVEKRGDVKRPMKEVRVIMLQIETNTSVYEASDEAVNAYYKYKQEDGETNANFFETSRALWPRLSILGAACSRTRDWLRQKE